MDSPGTSRAEKIRKGFLDEATVEEITERTDDISEFGAKFFGSRPPTKAEVCVRQPDHWQAPPHQAPDGAQLLTGMLVVGIVTGHGVMRAYRGWSEKKGTA